jgi:hypothetical protein
MQQRLQHATDEEMMAKMGMREANTIKKALSGTERKNADEALISDKTEAET